MTAAERDPGEGTLERTEDGRWRLRFERMLRHSPDKVWRALTEEEHLAAWFPTTMEGEQRAGAPLRFRFRGEEYPPSEGEMIEFDPPRSLEFTWGMSEEDIDQQERTRFELTPVGDGCRLTLLSTYDRVGKSARDAAGWHVCLDLLEAELAGEPRTGTSPERWKPLNRLYTERFGPEASTMKPPKSMPGYQEGQRG